jgi:hypothetical protein
MKNQSLLIIAAACSVSIVTIIWFVNRSENEGTFQQMASSFYVRQMSIGASPFDESAEMIFQDIRRSLLADENNQNLVQIAAELKWRIVGPMPKGVRSFTVNGGDIHSVIDSFADLWGVVVVIEGNTLVFTSKSQ